MAQQTASAEANRLIVTVTLGRTNRPKLMNNKVSQNVSMATNGMGTAEAFCANMTIGSGLV